MKPAYFPTLLLAASPIAVAAQITLSESTLPEVGERFESIVDTAYADVNGNIGRAGADRTWIFGNLQADGTACTTYSAPSDSMALALPGADLVERTGATCEDFETELFLERDGGDLSIVGLGVAPLPVVGLAAPVLYQRAPLYFGDAGSGTIEQRVEFGPDVIASLTDDEQIREVVDSIRVDLTVTTVVSADGWGRAGTTTDDLTDVLRVRRLTTTTQSTEARITFLGLSTWLAIAEIPGVDPNLLPPTEIVLDTYEWWADGRAAPLFRVTVDEEGQPITAERAVVEVSGLAEVADAEAALSVTSSAGGVVFTRETTEGAMRVHVYSVDGAQVAKTRLPDGQSSAAVDAATWPAGLYFARAIDARGRAETHRFLRLDSTSGSTRRRCCRRRRVRGRGRRSCARAPRR